MNHATVLSPNLGLEAVSAAVAPREGFLDRSGLLDLVHELRQPLGDIDALAYYLQLISNDDRTLGPLQRIQSLVVKANHILKGVCDCDSSPHVA